MKNVLVFPSGTEISNEVINSLKDNKTFKVVLASSLEKDYSSYRNRTVHFLPFVTADSFESDLAKLIADEEISFIIPAHDDVAHTLSTLQDKIDAKVIGQSQKVNEIVRFKDLTYEHFVDVVPLAGVYTTEPLPEQFPVFVKPIKGQGALNSQVLKDESEFKAFFSQHEINEFIIMENLPGDEFTIDCFSHHGKLLYAGARTREKMSRGIAIQTTYVEDADLQQQFTKHAESISENLDLHGVWFYQMKYNDHGELRLLEVGPRVSGTMMLNRARGVNFIELALYQKMGYDVEVVANDIQVSLARALVPIYQHNISYNKLYIDFDDALFLDEERLNSSLVKLIIDAKNAQKEVILITKNTKNNLTETLRKFGVFSLFDQIIHLTPEQKKIDQMAEKSLLIDDSFVERKQAINAGHYAYGLDAISVLETI